MVYEGGDSSVESFFRRPREKLLHIRDLKNETYILS